MSHPLSKPDRGQGQYITQDFVVRVAYKIDLMSGQLGMAANRMDGRGLTIPRPLRVQDMSRRHIVFR